MATDTEHSTASTEPYGAGWPIVWRLVCPAAGSYDHDMVFFETESKDDAVKRFRSMRRNGYPCRLERVDCGPLPQNYEDDLAELRSLNYQNPGTSLREIPGAWTKEGAASEVQA